MIISFDHFWGKIIRRSTICVSDFFFWVQVWPAKVTKFQLLVLNENVFWLEISMNNRGRSCVQVLYGLYYLLEVFFGVIFRNLLFGFDSVIKTALVGKLHNQVDFFMVIKETVKFNDVLVVQWREDLNLVLELRNESLLSQLLFGDDFKSVKFIILFELYFKDLAKWAWANLIYELKTLLK